MPEWSDHASLVDLFFIGNSMALLNKRSERRFGLSFTQWYLLSQLVKMPGASPLALSSAVGVAPGTITPLLKRLVKRGYIHVADSPQDSRRKIVAITRNGKLQMDKATGMIREWSEGLEGMESQIRRVRQLLESRALVGGSSANRGRQEHFVV